MNVDENIPAIETDEDDDQHVEFEAPTDVLAKARTLVAAGDYKTALDLLTKWRDEWAHVPPAYDAILGRCALREGDADSAVYYLTVASKEYGNRMPAEQRRDFATALMRAGRFEAAGRELSLVADAGAAITRPAHQAALAAFENRPDEALDSGPPTPHRILAQAAALADNKDFAAALGLLMKWRDEWSRIPPEYDAAVGRCALREGDANTAVHYLTKASAAYGDSMPADHRRDLAAALTLTGQVEAAGREFSLVARAATVAARSAHQAALDALEHRHADPLDSKPPTPQRVLAQAKALADSKNLSGALILLTKWRDEWPTVPAAYDALVGRCALREGDPNQALHHLTLASEAYGDQMPPGPRRDLATALILAGRVDAAAQELNRLAGDETGLRPAHQAALAAFAARRAGAPDSGDPTPYHVLAQAEALTDRKNLEAAHDLLAKALARHGAQWGDLPVDYEALLGRLSLRCGDRDKAVAHLTRARDMSGGSVPINIRQPLGTALFETARFDEAGRELDLAQRNGANIGRAELLIAINAYRRQTGDGEILDTTFARNLTVIDPDRQLAYVAVPKNACTLLKASVVLNSRYREAYLASGETIHRFCGQLMASTITAEIPSGPGSFRFVVLRDPLLRILSAYLDKVVRGRHREIDPYTEMQVARTVREAQAALGLPDDPDRSISFEEFARYLATAADVQLDMHWMPQVHMVGTDLSRYDHIGTVERVSATLDLLASRFGYDDATSLDPRLLEEDPHITKFSEAADLKHPYRALPHELDAFHDGVPMPALFFTPALKGLLEQRYAADMALYARA